MITPRQADILTMLGVKSVPFEKIRTKIGWGARRTLNNMIDDNLLVENLKNDSFKRTGRGGKALVAYSY